MHTTSRSERDQGGIILGCYDFCGHYEWTFEWLRRLGGEQLVHAYWDQAIRIDSQSHASQLILENGIPGMEAHWGSVLQHEGAGVPYDVERKHLSNRYARMSVKRLSHSKWARTIPRLLRPLYRAANE
ncbi:MAG: hypothetical protein SGI77_09160 [Pirellulaceae bacterium]|nr:hypothetical protein [Pirellulaceae bacterium]